MAEVFAVASSVAGLASLAIQLTDAVTKLKVFSRRMRHAPEALEELVFELETMPMALNEVHRERFREGPEDTVLLGRCLHACERGARKLRDVVGQVQKHQDKAKVLGQVYFALKERDEQTLLANLERAKSSLMFAFQLYTEARRRVDLERQDFAMQKLGHQLVTLPDETVLRIQAAALASASAMLEKDDMSPPGNRHLSRKSRHHGQSLRLRLPVSFCRRIWNCAVDRSLGGWGFRFETHNIRSNDAPVFSALKTRDLLGMRKMIAAGEASPFDCNADGASLLKLASRSNDLEIVQYLLENFVFTDIGKIASRVLTQRSFLMGRSVDPFDRMTDGQSSACESALLQAHFEHGTGDSMAYFDAGCDYQKSIATFSTTHCIDVFLRALPVPLQSLPFEARFACALHMGSIETIPSDFLKVCGVQGVTAELAVARTSAGKTALTMALDAIQERWGREKSLQAWDSSASCLIHQGADPHQAGQYWAQVTPLLRVLSPHSGISSPEIALSRLRAWARILAAAGVDLESYGAVECLHLQEIPRDSYKLLGLWGKYCISNLRYHADPDKWSMDVRPIIRVPLFVRRVVPGAWADVGESDSIPWILDEAGARNPLEAPVKVLLGRSSDIRDLILAETDMPSAVDAVVADTRSDHGIVQLFYSRRRAVTSDRAYRRHASQPPPLRRRERSYYTPTDRGGRNADPHSQRALHQDLVDEWEVGVADCLRHVDPSFDEEEEEKYLFCPGWSTFYHPFSGWRQYSGPPPLL